MVNASDFILQAYISLPPPFTEKRLNGFLSNLQDRSDMTHNLKHFGDASFNPLNTRLFFFIFLWGIRVCYDITGEWMNEFPWTLHDRSDITQSVPVTFNPWMHNYIFYFLDRGLLATLWKTAERIFMKFSGTRNNWLDCFTNHWTI